MSSKFNFDELVDRRGTTASKWNINEGELPMWVADMDFKAAPVVIETMQKIVEHGIFGYDYVPKSFYESVQDWLKRKHNVNVETWEIIYTDGVIPAIRSSLRALTNEGDGVVMFTPTYNNFYTSIFYNNLELVDCPLDYKEGVYTINWEKLEEVLSKDENKIFLFCNPQNPIGMNYNLDDLERIAKLCKKHDVYMFCDEIHADLIHPGEEHFSASNVALDAQDNLLVFNSVTKSFNLAGMKAAYVICRNQDLKAKLERRFEQDKAMEINSFGVKVSEACYSKEGEEWLDALNEYLAENRKLLETRLTEALPDLVFSPANATYLAWINTSNYAQDSKHMADFMRYKTGLFVQAGEIYGQSGYKFIRWNYACPREMLEDGINRFIEGMKEYQELGISYIME